MEREVILFCVIFNRSGSTFTHFKQIIYLIAAYSVGVVNVAVRTRYGNDLCPEFGKFKTRAPRYVAVARKSKSFAFYIFAEVFEYFFQKIYGAVTGCFGADKTSAESHSFAGKHAVLIVSYYFFVLTE